MSERRPRPYSNALDRCLLVQTMTSSSVALLGTSHRNNQIELRSGIDNPAYAAKNSIHFSKCAKSIDVNRLQARGLREQLLVGHFENPRLRVRGHLNMDVSATRQKCELQLAESFVAGTGIIPSGIFVAHQTAVRLS